MRGSRRPCAARCPRGAWSPPGITTHYPGEEATTPGKVMAGLTLDAGALIALERNDRRIVALLARARHHGWALVVPEGVVGQVWRDGKRQARLARLLASE